MVLEVPGSHKVCIYCLKRFKPKRPDQKYCEINCRLQKNRLNYYAKRSERARSISGAAKPEVHRNCTTCKQDFVVCRNKKVFCSAKCRVKKNKRTHSKRLALRYRILKMLGATPLEARLYARKKELIFNIFKEQLSHRRQLG